MDSNKFIKCFLSDKGHKNFYYPSDVKVLINEGCRKEPLNWLGGNHRNLRAIKILKSCVLPLYITHTVATNMAPPEKDIYIAVWVEK
jgi:hypothetical protein